MKYSKTTIYELALENKYDLKKIRICDKEEEKVFSLLTMSALKLAEALRSREYDRYEVWLVEDSEIVTED